MNDESRYNLDRRSLKHMFYDFFKFFFQQQYSPMVMRKFKRSLDHTAEDSDPNQLGLNSPRLSRRNRGGSFSGASLTEIGPDSTNSPIGRRRRSRIPSEEDDQLINYLVTGGHDASRERNLSVGNLVAESQQNYGSLDRGLMRRSRGRRPRPDMLNEDRDRSAPIPTPPKPDTEKKEGAEKVKRGHFRKCTDLCSIIVNTQC